MEDNPFFHNALALDLFAWDIISWSKYKSLLRDPWKEAERVEKTNLTRSDPSLDQEVLEARIRFWKEEYTSVDSRVARRWPHPVYPPLPSMPRPPLTPPA